MNTPIEDLFALAEEAIAPVIWTEKEALKKFKESATPERVREVAKAFRALEQRSEAAEAALALVREQRDSELNRNNELEAKLAEYEKQKPVAWTDDGEMRDIKNQAAAYMFPINDTMPITEPQRVIKLFTRPAPAVNLAELVPPKASMADFYENVTEGNRSDPDAAGIEMWDACRAAMLRNIEEKAGEA